MTVEIREISLVEPGAGPYGITAGPDGALWLTLAHAGGIARLSPDGPVRIYPLDPAGARPGEV